MPLVFSRANLSVFVVIVALLTIGWAVYSPALGGAFLLDDSHNLRGLSRVSDLNSAIQFILSGGAGPGGRPVALASFVPQAESWGGPAAPFIRVNILIHLFNGFLAYCFFYQLAITQRIKELDARTVAIAAMALWLFMPLLASSSLMVVQRMATLSACFVLIGLNVYLLYRTRMTTSPRTALVGMSLAIVFAGSLAILAKENGALLPALIFVLEATLLTRPAELELRKWRIWQSITLVAPTIAIFALLILRASYSDAVVLRKGFSAADRLLTEATVLWQYLLNGVFPRAAELGPFHDDFPISTTILQPSVMLAVVAWVAVVVAAIRWRRRYSVAAFAALWFLTGHLLESTSLPLYLYFEHRNYVPMMGPVFAASFLLVLAGGNYRIIARAGLALFVLFNVAILFSVASLWGSPQVAAGYWQSNAPRSADAAGYLASVQLSNIGPEAAMLTLQQFALQNAEHGYLRLPELTLSCRTAPGKSHDETVEYLKTNLPLVSYAPEVGPMLDELLSTSYRANCEDVDPVVVRDLILLVYSNPRYNSSRKHSSIHHQLLAKLSRNSGDIDDALRQLMLAKAERPSDDINLMIVSLLVGERRFDEARQFIDQATGELSTNPVKRASGTIKLKELRQYVDAVEDRA